MSKRRGERKAKEEGERRERAGKVMKDGKGKARYIYTYL